VKQTAVDSGGSLEDYANYGNRPTYSHEKASW